MHQQDLDQLFQGKAGLTGGGEATPWCEVVAAESQEQGSKGREWRHGHSICLPVARHAAFNSQRYFQTKILCRLSWLSLGYFLYQSGNSANYFAVAFILQSLFSLGLPFNSFLPPCRIGTLLKSR